MAQSSAEAELGAAHRGALFAIGIHNMWSEFYGEHLNIAIVTDSMAAKLISTRRGVGRVRHLEIRQLYLQRLTNSGRVKILKCKGTTNLADAGTKPMQKKSVPGFRTGLGIVRQPLAEEDSSGRGVVGLLALPSAVKRQMALLLASMLIGEGDAVLDTEPSSGNEEDEAYLGFRSFVIAIFLAGWFAHMIFSWAWHQVLARQRTQDSPLMGTHMPPSTPMSSTGISTSSPAPMISVVQDISQASTISQPVMISQQEAIKDFYVSAGGERYHVDRMSRADQGDRHFSPLALQAVHGHRTAEQ
jgi:hypothetical protein